MKNSKRKFTVNQQTGPITFSYSEVPVDEVAGYDG